MGIKCFEVKLINGVCHVTVDIDEGWIELVIHVRKINTKKYMVTVSEVKIDSIETQTKIINKDPDVIAGEVEFDVDSLHLIVTPDVAEISMN